MGNKKKIRPDSPVQSTQLASSEEALTDPLEEAPEPAPARIGWGRYLLEAIGVYTVAFLFMQHLQTLTKHARPSAGRSASTAWTKSSFVPRT